MDNCSASRKVELSATAGGPDVDGELLFVWAVSAGHIRGEGPKVIWDLSDVADGTYTAHIEVNDGTGLTAYASTKVTIALCRSCITRESPCPTIMVSCPDNAKSNESIKFQAHVYGGDPTVKVTYTWSVSAGKISGGQGTSMITVDVSEVVRGSITATVSIGGHHPACVNTASCTTRTAGGVAKVGRYGACAAQTAGVITCRESFNENGEPSRARTCDPLIKSAITSTAPGYGSYDLLTFVTGCSRQRVHLLPPIQPSFGVLLSQVCPIPFSI